MCGDADRGVVSSSRDAEQNYAIVCAKRGCQFFHWPSPTYQNTRDHKGSLVYLAAHTHSVNGRWQGSSAFAHVGGFSAPQEVLAGRWEEIGQLGVLPTPSLGILTSRKCLDVARTANSHVACQA